MHWQVIPGQPPPTFNANRSNEYRTLMILGIDGDFWSDSDEEYDDENDDEADWDGDDDEPDSEDTYNDLSVVLTLPLDVIFEVCSSVH
jgi:hypothetical protein